MKVKFFSFGFIVGGLVLYLSSYIINKTKESNVEKNNASLKTNTAKWNWPDSLDALVAAPVNYKLVFENEEFRILEVTVNPGQLDPIHTHKGESIVWAVMTSPIVYNTFGLDSNNKFMLIKKDTIIVKPEELNIGIRENPEQPHSVQNIGKDTFRLYRIEYKNNKT